MNKSFCNNIFSCLLPALILTGIPAQAGALTIPHAFEAGTPAVAAQVNANFTAVKTAVNDNDARIAALEARLDELEDYIARLQEVMTLGADAQDRPAVMFSGVNVHINNGADETNSANGLGNLIVGYDEPRSTGPSSCSQGEYDNQTDCEANGAAWALSYKSGSHNVVIGPEHNYSQYGGFVAGIANTVNGVHATVSGGGGNAASYFFSSVSGGMENTANGVGSSISGGVNNTASGAQSTVCGGKENSAIGWWSSISGGQQNKASGSYSSVSGGSGNEASGEQSSITAGAGNIASGNTSSISGGNGNTANGDTSSISGGVSNIASGTQSSISGGGANTASGEISSISGGSGNIASWNSSSISGGVENLASGDGSSVGGGNGNVADEAYEHLP